MNWFHELPTSPGWYWRLFWREADAIPHVVYICNIPSLPSLGVMTTNSIDWNPLEDFDSRECAWIKIEEPPQHKGQPK